MKKGFTLIELIALVVLIGIIALLAVPQILTLVRETRNQLSDATKEMIFNAADLYTSKYSNDYEIKSGYVYCIEIEILVKEKFLQEPIKDTVTNQEISLDTIIEAKAVGNNFVFSINNDCLESSSAE